MHAIISHVFPLRLHLGQSNELRQRRRLLSRSLWSTLIYCKILLERLFSRIMHLLYIRSHWLLVDAATEELLLRGIHIISWNHNIEPGSAKSKWNDESSISAKYLSFV
jgi:hypothetical protein